MGSDGRARWTGPIRLARSLTRGRALAWSAFVSVVLVLMTAVWPDDRRSTGDPTVGDVVRVGVVDGDSIPGYVQSSSLELAALLAASPSGPGHTEPYALVAFSTYLAPDQLTPILAGASVSVVVGRVPLPDTQTQIVWIPAVRIPADVITGMAQVAERRDREAREYRDRSAALPESGDQELRRVYDRGARVAFAEADAYRSHCACIYAAVVRAGPAVLEQIAVRSDVRVVDPAPEVRRLDRAVFLPPLPEQADMVHPPADGAMPPVGGVPDGTADGEVGGTVWPS